MLFVLIRLASAAAARADAPFIQTRRSGFSKRSESSQLIPIVPSFYTLPLITRMARMQELISVVLVKSVVKWILSNGAEAKGDWYNSLVSKVR